MNMLPPHVAQYDWTKNNHQLAREYGKDPSAFWQMRKRYKISYGPHFKNGFEWGREVERWARKTLFPVSVDLNEVNPRAPFDLYDKVYGRVDIKSSVVFHNRRRNHSLYVFEFLHHGAHHKCDYYLFVGLDESRKPETTLIVPAKIISLPRSSKSITRYGKGWEEFIVPQHPLYSMS